MTSGERGNTDIAIERLDTGERRVVIQGGRNPKSLPTGHVVYYLAGALMAVPFDAGRLETVGTPVPVLEGVAGTAPGSTAGQFNVSSLGTLVYVPGSSQTYERTFVWVDRKGAVQPISAPPRVYMGGRLSPDGGRIAVEIQDPRSNIWIYDLARDTLTRLTFDGSSASPHWMPDGKRIVFQSAKEGTVNLFWKPADGSGPDERLAKSEYQQVPSNVSRDGRFLAYGEDGPKTGRDLWVLPLEGERKPRLFLRTTFTETAPRFSPDGRWLAYVSNESGRDEVYLQPFPGPGGKYQVSTEGGAEISWESNGELFYRAGARREKMMAVEITTQPQLIVGKPRVLFEGDYATGQGAGASYSVTRDGQRFLMMKQAEQQESAGNQIDVVLNWTEELKRRVSVR